MKTYKIIKATLVTLLAFLAGLPLLATEPEKTENTSATSVSAPPPSGCNLPISATRDLVADFGAYGNGIFDDSPAFKRASDWINANWSTTSSIKITVPAGTYLVGKQIRKGDTWNYGTGTMSNPSQSYLGVRVFELLQAKNVIIEGAPGQATKIVYKNGLIYGGYRTDTDQPCNARNNSCANSCNPLTTQLDVANVGAFLYLDRCQCITANNFWVEGHYNMCNRKGNVGECGTIQLEYDGVLLAGGSDINISNVSCANFGRDGIMTYRSNGIDPSNVTLTNFISSGNGRQGFSIAAGINISATNCDFVLSGKIKDGAIYNGYPQAGLDIEPDQVGLQINGCIFNNCRFTNNANYAFISDKHNPSNITFDGCLFSARKGYAMHPEQMINSKVKNSTIFGQLLHVKGGGPNDNLIFDNNYITDWFGDWKTNVSTTWPSATSSAYYLFDFGDPTANLYYTFKNNTVELRHSYLIISEAVPNPTTDRTWDSNKFNFYSDDMLSSTNGYPQLWQGGGLLGNFKTCNLISNQFIDLQPDPIQMPNPTYVIGVKTYPVSTGLTDPADCTTDGLNYFGPNGPNNYTYIRFNPTWLWSWSYYDGNW